MLGLKLNNVSKRGASGFPSKRVRDAKLRPVAVAVTAAVAAAAVVAASGQWADSI